MLVTALFLQLVFCSALTSHVRGDVSSKFEFGNLRGEADFRAVTLRWESMPAVHFLITTCEIQPAASSKCKTQEVGRGEDLRSEETVPPRHRNWSSTVSDLRVATHYAFQVKAFHLDTSREISPPKTISVHTKGFSATTKECLGRYSGIHVETGPFFGGRISVENSQDARCYIDGDQRSSRTSYEFVVDHEHCNSATNETSVISTIMVQENAFVLTHSAKRFVVVCTYQPGSIVVQSSLQRPVDSIKTIDPVARTEERLQDLAAENLVQLDNGYTSRESLGRPSKKDETSTVGLILSIFSFSAIVVFCLLIASASYYFRRKCKRTMQNQPSTV